MLPPPPGAALGLLGATVLPQRLLRLQPLLDRLGHETITSQLALDPASLVPDPLLTALESARRVRQSDEQRWNDP